MADTAPGLSRLAAMLINPAATSRHDYHISLKCHLVLCNFPIEGTPLSVGNLLLACHSSVSLFHPNGKRGSDDRCLRGPDYLNIGSALFPRQATRSLFLLHREQAFMPDQMFWAEVYRPNYKTYGKEHAF